MVDCRADVCASLYVHRRVARAEYQYQREREAIKDEHARKREEKANRREEIKKKYGQFHCSMHERACIVVLFCLHVVCVCVCRWVWHVHTYMHCFCIDVLCLTPSITLQDSSTTAEPKRVGTRDFNNTKYLL